MLETARSSTFLFLTGPFGVWRTHASGLPVQTEVYKTFMQIRLLLFLLCIFLMTPIDGYVKAGNGEDTLYYAGRTFSPNSSIGRNNHSLLLKTNAVAWGMAVMNVAVEYDISPAISVLIPFYYSPFNYFTSSRKKVCRNARCTSFLFITIQICSFSLSCDNSKISLIYVSPASK